MKETKLAWTNGGEEGRGEGGERENETETKRREGGQVLENWIYTVYTVYHTIYYTISTVYLQMY